MAAAIEHEQLAPPQTGPTIPIEDLVGKPLEAKP